MSIHTKKCERMLELTSFMLDCVRINRDAFNDISDKMGSLQTLAMWGVFGIQTTAAQSPVPWTRNKGWGCQTWSAQFVKASAENGMS
jgi:hypothetical protein